MTLAQCKEALEIYKKFIVRMDRVRAFLRVAEVTDDCGFFVSLTHTHTHTLTVSDNSVYGCV